MYWKQFKKNPQKQPTIGHFIKLTLMQFSNDFFNKYVHTWKYALHTIASIVKWCTFIKTQNKWTSLFPEQERLKLIYSCIILHRKLSSFIFFLIMSLYQNQALPSFLQVNNFKKVFVKAIKPKVSFKTHHKNVHTYEMAWLDYTKISEFSLTQLLI